MVFLVRGGDAEIMDFLKRRQTDILWRRRAAEPDALLLLSGDRNAGLSIVHTAVIPLDAAVTAKQVVSYGLEQTCTVTLSSRRPEGWMLALQRDIVNLRDERVERQELPLPPSENPERTLALSAALLVAGCPPAKLFDRMSGF